MAAASTPLPTQPASTRATICHTTWATGAQGWLTPTRSGCAADCAAFHSPLTFASQLLCAELPPSAYPAAACTPGASPTPPTHTHAPHTPRQSTSASGRFGTLRARPAGSRTQFIVDERGHLLPSECLVVCHMHALAVQYLLVCRPPQLLCLTWWVIHMHPWRSTHKPHHNTLNPRRPQSAQQRLPERRGRRALAAPLARRGADTARAARRDDGLQGHPNQLPAHQHRHDQDGYVTATSTKPSRLLQGLWLLLMCSR